MMVPMRKIPAAEARRIGPHPSNTKIVLVENEQGYIECDPKDADITISITYDVLSKSVKRRLLSYNN